MDTRPTEANRVTTPPRAAMLARVRERRVEIAQLAGGLLPICLECTDHMDDAALLAYGLRLKAECERLRCDGDARNAARLKAPAYQARYAAAARRVAEKLRHVRALIEQEMR